MAQDQSRFPGIEIWKDIPRYEGYYKVSNLGRVQSLARDINKGNKHPRSKLTEKQVLQIVSEIEKGVSITELGKRYGIGKYVIFDIKKGDSWGWLTGRGGSKYYGIKTKILKTSIGSGGYPNVTLCKDGTIRWFNVHSLVMLAFIGPCPKGLEIRHYPDPEKSNCRLDNLSYGTHLENEADKDEHGTRPKGELVGTSVLTNTVIREIDRLLRMGVAGRDLAKRYKVHDSYISRIKLGLTWRWLTGRSYHGR